MADFSPDEQKLSQDWIAVLQGSGLDPCPAAAVEIIELRASLAKAVKALKEIGLVEQAEECGRVLDWPEVGY